MSRQPGPPPPYYPQQPGYTGRDARRIQPPRQSRAGFGFAMFMLGVLFTVIAAGIAVFFLYFYNPNPNAPLPRPAAQADAPDLAATLSQTYLNREISRSLSAKPFQAGSVLIRDIVVVIKADSQMDVTMRASTGPATFDLLVTESLAVENGKIKINIVGQPKVTGGALPPGVTQLLDQVNTQFIEPQINNEVNSVSINQRPLQLTAISTTPGFITLKTTVQ